MTPNERLSQARKTLRMTQREFAAKISVTTGFVAAMEIGDRKVNPRIMKLVSSLYNISLRWLETGEGEMFYTGTEQEIEEIINLYKQLNPFFKKFIINQLRELTEFKGEKGDPKSAQKGAQKGDSHLFGEMPEIGG